MLEKYKNNVEEKPKKRMFIRLFLFLVIIFLISGLILLSWVFLKKKKNEILKNNTDAKKTLTQEKENSTASISKSQQDKLSFREEKEASNQDEAKSQNYRIKQIRFGGNILLADKNKDLPLEILDVKSETVTSRENGEPEFLITWKTNKEAISEIIYAKNDGSDVKRINEDGYGFEHSILLDNIDFSTIYVFRIRSKDRWGNSIATEYFSAYTGEKSASIFDLIANAIEDVFGWAMKK